MRASRLTMLFSLVGILSLSGCALMPPDRLYQLQASEPALPEDGTGMRLLLGPLTLADYLQHESLVQRQEDGSLSLDTGARWAGSLQDDVAQLLLRQLAGRLDTSRVALYPDRAGFDAEAQVLVGISRLDSGPEQPAVLAAQWRLLDGRGRMRNSRLLRLQEAHNGTLADQVKAQSRLLQRLSEQLAEAIRPLAVAGSKPARRQITAKAPTEPAPPVSSGSMVVMPPEAPPLNTNLEVFRF